MVKVEMDIEWVPRSVTQSTQINRNISVTAPSFDELMSDLKHHFCDRRGFSIATLNLDHVVKLRKDTAFLKAYSAHSHVTADGNPIVWLSRLARRKVTLIPGADLIDPVLSLAAALDVPVAFLGSSQEALARAAQILQTRHDGLQIVAQISPPMGFNPTGPLALTYIEELRRTDAQLCLIALGAPRQEMFAIYAAEKLPQVGFMSIGAGLDFHAGDQTRAPRILRSLALEWVWRLLNNPRRLATRYLACIAVLPRLICSALWARRHNMTAD